MRPLCWRQSLGEIWHAETSIFCAARIGLFAQKVKRGLSAKIRDADELKPGGQPCLADAL